MYLGLDIGRQYVKMVTAEKTKDGYTPSIHTSHHITSNTYLQSHILETISREYKSDG